MTTLRPFGPKVTLTALARMSTPRSILSRESDPTLTSLAVTDRYPYLVESARERVVAVATSERTDLLAQLGSRDSPVPKRLGRAMRYPCGACSKTTSAEPPFATTARTAASAASRARLSTK